jgi:hypothetical protein
MSISTIFRVVPWSSSGRAGAGVDLTFRLFRRGGIRVFKVSDVQST